MKTSAPDESLMLHPVSLAVLGTDVYLEAMVVVLEKDFERLTHLAITLRQGTLIDGIKFQGLSFLKNYENPLILIIYSECPVNIRILPLNPTGLVYATGQDGRVRRSLIREEKKASLPQGEDFQAEVASVQDPLALDLTDTEKETDRVILSQLGVVVGLLLPLNYQTPVDINLVGTFDAETGHVVPYQVGCLLVIRPLWRNNGEFHVLYKNYEHRPLRLSMKLPRASADSHLIYYDEWTTSLKSPMSLDSVPKKITSFQSEQFT
ncbi:hypothetical protein FNYG_01715 [Fusarium nygamai]|uniref:Uncharacterized protein n=1 Tax=Gibberella nygamai TaxID=42673 RepID=A0A2K0WRH2_GIBNY|nr:hypothetical protein FNYG_01715 [Fusarium nygamai]